MATNRTRQGTLSDERYLVTGALGCVGAWTVRALVRERTSVVAFDLAADPRRLRLILSPEEIAAVTFVTGDITDLESIDRAMDEHEITHVIHLAALQVPACRANPPLGARVNVLGTANVFDAVRRRSDRIRHLVYAGSIGMFVPTDIDPRTGRLEANTTAHPMNHYGVFKQANEGTARVYWLENGLSSIGLRPMTVYGPGRDQGLTSTPTAAILAAVLGRTYTISFGGRTLFHYAEDVGRAFIIASRSSLEGAQVFNLGGDLVHVRDFAAEIEGAVPGAVGLISVADPPLPFPEDVATEEVAALGVVPITPLRQAIVATAELFQARLEQGLLLPEEYGLEAAG